MMDMCTHLDKVQFTVKVDHENLCIINSNIVVILCPYLLFLNIFIISYCSLVVPSVHPSERLIGLPDSMLKNRSCPQVVPSLEGLFIEDIAVGCEHVLALSSTGDVYAWGCNSEGQVKNNLWFIHLENL